MLGIIFSLAAFTGLAAALALYFLPTLLARSRFHPAAGGIFLVNLCFGWTFAGWLLALAWAAFPIGRVPRTATIVSPARPLVKAPVGTILPPASYAGRR